MSELDERAVAKAAMAVGDALWRHVAQNPETIARAAVTAYLAAARPTPDAAAMERFEEALFDLTEAAKAFALVEAPVDAGGATFEQGEAYCAAHQVLEQAEAQLTVLFRKAVSR